MLRLFEIFFISSSVVATAFGAGVEHAFLELHPGTGTGGAPKQLHGNRLAHAACDTCTVGYLKSTGTCEDAVDGEEDLKMNYVPGFGGYGFKPCVSVDVAPLGLDSGKSVCDQYNAVCENASCKCSKAANPPDVLPYNCWSNAAQQCI